VQRRPVSQQPGKEAAFPCGPFCFDPLKKGKTHEEVTPVRIDSRARARGLPEKRGTQARRAPKSRGPCPCACCTGCPCSRRQGWSGTSGCACRRCQGRKRRRSWRPRQEVVRCLSLVPRALPGRKGCLQAAFFACAGKMRAVRPWVCLVRDDDEHPRTRTAAATVVQAFSPFGSEPCCRQWWPPPVSPALTETPSACY